MRDAIANAAGRLGSATETPRLDAELLMAHALGMERELLLLEARSLEDLGETVKVRLMR